MDQIKLKKGVALNTEIAVFKEDLQVEENRITILTESFDEKLRVDIKVRGIGTVWIIRSTDILHIYRKKVEVLKEKIKELEYIFKKL